MPRVKTFHGDYQEVEGELLQVSDTGLCMVQLDGFAGCGKLVARAKAGLVPLDDEARRMLDTRPGLDPAARKAGV